MPKPSFVGADSTSASTTLPGLDYFGCHAGFPECFEIWNFRRDLGTKSVKKFYRRQQARVENLLPTSEAHRIAGKGMKKPDENSRFQSAPLNVVVL
jgi:hypothetical protein